MWALANLPPDTGEQLERWLDDLAELTPDEWLAIGHRCIAHGAESKTTTARALLDAIVGDQRLEATAWFVRDLVETAMHLVNRRAARLPQRERRSVSAATEAARYAALAIAVEPWLPPEDRSVLAAPFQRGGTNARARNAGPS